MAYELQDDFTAHSTASYNLAWGVVSSGKTYTQIRRWLAYCYTEAPPGSMLLMTGKTSGSLWVNIIREMCQLVPSLKYTEKPGTIEIPERKIEIACVGAWNDRDWERVSGGSFSGWLADEATLAPKNFMQICIKSIRVAPALKFWTFNPDHPRHWIKTDILDNQDIDCRKWFFRFGDNPTLTEKYVKETSAAFTGLFYQRYILGRWVAAEGAVFDRWNPAKQIIPLIDIQSPQWSGRKRVLVIDFGFAVGHAFCCQFWVHLPPGVHIEHKGSHLHGPCWIRYREIYHTGRTVSDHARQIKELSARDGYTPIAYCDHDPESIEQLRRAGIQAQLATKPTVVNGIQAIQDAFARDQIYLCDGSLVEKDPELAKAGLPTCTEEEIPQAEWATDREGSIKREDYKAGTADHGIKNIAYLLTSMTAGQGYGEAITIDRPI